MLYLVHMNIIKIHHNLLSNFTNNYQSKELLIMGGNALKTITTTRKSPVDYEKIKDYVLRVLCEKLSNTGIQWCVPHEAPGKDSYGDLDVLLTRQSEFDIREWILATFKPDEIVSNGGVYSFNIGNEEGQHIARDFQGDGNQASGSSLARDFQVDFITTPAENFAVHHFFLSWGDCGMLVGQIAHAAGLRFGQQGLFIGISDRPGMSDDLILSKDPRKICEFLGLDFDRWYNRFVSEPDIFAWLCESPFMRNIKLDRSRRCREMYLRFGEFVKTQRAALDELSSTEPSDVADAPSLDAVVAYFGKQADFAAIQKKQSDAVRRSEKFGAHLFSALGDIPGRELGQIIARFKQTIPGDFKAWVLATDEAEIQVAVSGFLSSSGFLPVGN